MRVTVSRKAHFNSAHRLYRPDWSFEKNDAVFGKCNNPNYHGHNYDLTVSVTGEIDPETGFVMDVKILKDFIKSEVEDAFDHKNLNLDVPEFPFFYTDLHIVHGTAKGGAIDIFLSELNS